MDVRQPVNLMQAVENVAGVNQVSEGQAAVPAVRGLARGRTLILIDGARVTAERRVGPSATYMDPAIVEGVDVSRGPGSVAYGSDAFGGVISVRTRRVAPRTPWQAQLSATAGTGIPDRRVAGQVSRGLEAGSVLVAVHTREAGDWDSPQGEVFNSGFRDSGVLARVEHGAGPGLFSVGWQSDFGRDIERPRNNSRTVRFFYPYENSHRLTASYEHAGLGGFRRFGVRTFLGTYEQRTDQDRFATATAGRTIERADISAKDFGVRVSSERAAGPARVEMGLDLNGRFGLRAIDDLLTFDLSGGLASARPNLSIDRAHRTDTGLYASVDAAVAPALSLGAGVRGDYVVTQNTGGYFGDLSTGNGGGSGYVALTAGSFGGVSTTVQVARGFRDPTLSDRYYRGPTGRGFITGNPDLDPETSLQFDWSVRYTAPRYRAAAFYYHYRIDDLIERCQTATDDFFFFRNRGRARVRGFEESRHRRNWGGLLGGRLHAGRRGRRQDTGAYLDDITPLNLTTVVRKAFGPRGFAQARVAFFSEDTHPGPTEREVPGYTLLDVQGGYRLAATLELRVQARNLLNQEYLASQDNRAVLAPGRSASLTLAVRF
ncbi:MAG: TonB-dependent receptor [Vicinamibacterales bacterium]